MPHITVKMVYHNLDELNTVLNRHWHGSPVGPMFVRRDGGSWALWEWTYHTDENGNTVSLPSLLFSAPTPGRLSAMMHAMWIGVTSEKYRVVHSTPKATA